jgi:hypothetical protein
MITVNLKGGLGNQLFQYSVGRALSLRKNQPLNLDISGYIKHNAIDTPRQYELVPFNIQANVPALEEVEKLRNPYGIFTKGLRFFKMKFLRKFNLHFYSTKGVYLDGFFQSEKYFKDYEKVIRQDLTLKNPLGPKAQEISGLIKNTPNSISLHVRRGDYVQDATTNKYWGTCSPEYYSKALEYITSKIGQNVHVFVFSDDIKWVRENMPLNFLATYIDPADMKDYESLILMSQCNHHIIANSSFSWWGAWLDQKSDKIVVAPSIWARKTRSLYKDIIPSSWIKI